MARMPKLDGRRAHKHIHSDTQNTFKRAPAQNRDNTLAHTPGKKKWRRRNWRDTLRGTKGPVELFFFCTLV